LSCNIQKYFQNSVIDYTIFVIDYQWFLNVGFQTLTWRVTTFDKINCVIDYTIMVIDYQWLVLKNCQESQLLKWLVLKKLPRVTTFKVTVFFEEIAKGHNFFKVIGFWRNCQKSQLLTWFLQEPSNGYKYMTMTQISKWLFSTSF